MCGSLLLLAAVIPTAGADPAAGPEPAVSLARWVTTAAGEPVVGAKAVWVAAGGGDAAGKVLAVAASDAAGSVSLSGRRADPVGSWLFVAADGLATHAEFVPHPGRRGTAAGSTWRRVTLHPAAAVRGEVIDAASGLPIAGVLVTREPGRAGPGGRPKSWETLEAATASAARDLGRRPLVVTTDAGGGYRLADLPARETGRAGRTPRVPLPGVRLRFSAAGFVSVEVRPDGRGEVIDVELEPAGTLTGRVTNAAGEPIAGARVGVMSRHRANLFGMGVEGSPAARFVTGTGSATTAADGRYVIRELPAAIYRLTAWPPADAAAVEPRPGPAVVENVVVVAGAPNDVAPVRLPTPAAAR